MAAALQSSPRWRESRTLVILLGLFGLMVLCGLPALHQLLSQGASARGSTGAGLFSVTHAFFAGISAGAFFVATLPFVFATRQFAPLGRLSLFVAFVTQVAAVVSAMVDPQPTSGWLLSLYGIYGTVLVAMLFLTLRPALGRGAQPTTEAARTEARLLRGLGIAGLVVAVGFSGSAGATSAGLLTLSIVLLAATSGAALVLAVAVLMVRGGEAYRQAVCSLGRLVGILLTVQVAVLIAGTLLALNGGAPEQIALARSVAFGKSGWLFWGVQILSGSAVPLLVLFRKQPSLRSIALASMLIMLGVFAFRLNLALPRFAGLGETSSFVWVVTLNFVLFCVGLAGCLFAIGYRMLPLVGRDVAMEFQAAAGAIAMPYPGSTGWELPVPQVAPAPRPAAAVVEHEHEEEHEHEHVHVKHVDGQEEIVAPGAFTARWWIAFVAAVALLGFGAYSFVYQEHYGEITTGMRTTGGGGAGWGLYVAFLTYFIGVSFAGTAAAALTHLFKLRSVRPLCRMAELISILALALAAVCIIADQGRPTLALMNLPAYTKVTSPFFGTFVLMCTYLFASVVFFFLDGRSDAAAMAARGGRLAPLYRAWAFGWKGTAAELRRNDRTCFWLSCVTLVMLVVEQSTIGFIFGTQIGRPGWFSTLQAPGFLLLAGVSGIGLLLAVTVAVRSLLGLQQQLSVKSLRWLAGALLVLLALELYFLATESVTSFYAGAEGDSKIAHVIAFGAYSKLFWTMVGSLVAAFLITVSEVATPATSSAWLVGAGVLANVGVALKRYLLVVPSQTESLNLPLDAGSYAPTWVEYGVIGGAIGLAVAIYLVFVRIFPVLHRDHFHDAVPAEPFWSRMRRMALVGLTLLFGAGLAAAGLLSSARIGNEHYLDPEIPASPMVFIIGVATMLLSAVVHDTLRTREPTSARRKIGG